MSEYTVFKPYDDGKERWWAMVDIQLPKGINSLSADFPLISCIKNNLPILPDDGEKHHVCIKYDDGKIIKYIDGLEIT